jgi:GH25 family lysozyme M1 (1,4-beta-N-acetylmuramidase)
MKGIDIAKWNPVTDYAKVAQQIDFAVLKIINKQNSEDGLFATHLKGCRDNNIPLFGVYNYSYAETTSKAVSDAQAVINSLKRHNLNTVVWIDVEEESIANKLGKKLIDVIYAYKDTIEAAGYKFGIYTGLSFYNTHIKPYIGLSSIPMWIARYPSSSPMTIKAEPNATKKPDVTNLVAWQYSSKGQINGIKGNVDLDISYVSYEELLNYNTQVDLNNKPILRKGDRNEYVKAWQTLLNVNGYQCGNADGIFGDKTEKAVVRWQQDHGMEAGYIGEETWKTI